MKIGISTSVIQRGQTGIAQYLFALLRAFGNCDTEHEFVLFVLEDDVPLFAFAKDYVQIVTVPETHRPPVKNVLWHQRQLPALAKQYGLDVLHVPSYRRMLWPQPCALVSTIHDLAPFHVTGKYDWKRMFYGKVVVKRLAHRQHEIIAISENTARDVSRFFKVQNHRITVIHNGLDHERFFPTPKEAAKKVITEKYGINAPFFLYVARLEHPAKNHVRLVEAFNGFKAATKSDWRLVLGGSDWHGAEAIHQAIDRSPFRDQIDRLGFVAGKDLPTLYRAADTFVYPSLFEGFGLPPVEAMACGCPVISSDRGSLGEIVGKAAVIVNPDNVADLQQQLTALATDQRLREKLTAAGLMQARKFDWNTTATETLKIYKRALTRQSKIASIEPLPLPVSDEQPRLQQNG